MNVFNQIEDISPGVLSLNEFMNKVQGILNVSDMIGHSGDAIVFAIFKQYYGNKYPNATPDWEALLEPVRSIKTEKEIDDYMEKELGNKMSNKIWYPILGDIYETEINDKTYYIRFENYGLGSAHSGRPLWPSFKVYDSAKCERKVVGLGEVDIYELEYTKVAHLNTLKENKVQLDISKVMKSMSTRTGIKRGSRVYDIKLSGQGEVHTGYGSWLVFIDKNDGGYNFQVLGPGNSWGLSVTLVEKFSSLDVVSLNGNLNGNNFEYLNEGGITQFVFR